MKRVFIILLVICAIGASAFAENEIAFLADYHADCLDLSSMGGLYLGRRVLETEISKHAPQDPLICSFPSAYFISGSIDGFPVLAFYIAYAKEVRLYLWKNGEVSKTRFSFPDIEAELILAYVNHWIYYFNETGIYRSNGNDVELLYSAEDAGVYMNAENPFFKPAVSENGSIVFIDGDLICIEPDRKIIRFALERNAYNWGTEKPYGVMPTAVWLNNDEILFFYMFSEETNEDMHLEAMLADVHTSEISRCMDASGNPIKIQNRYVGERGLALKDDQIILIMSDFAYPSPDYIYSYEWSCNRVSILSLQDGSINDIFINNTHDEPFGSITSIAVKEEIVYNSCIVKVKE